MEWTMTCHRATWHRPEPLPGLDIIAISADAPVDLIRETMTINEQGFDPAAPAVDAATAEAFRPSLVDCLAVTARWNGQPVAAGMFNPIHEGRAELAGIATLVEFRRRGFGGAVTSALTAYAFDRGAEEVYLTTDDDGAHRVYLRLGFTDFVGT